MKERPLSEYPTDRCIATIMNDLLHKDYFLLYYSYHCIHCQNGEKIALSVLCSKKGMLFIVNDLFEKNHVSSSFNFILKSYRECYGLA